MWWISLKIRELSSPHTGLWSDEHWIIKGGQDHIYIYIYIYTMWRPLSRYLLVLLVFGKLREILVMTSNDERKSVTYVEIFIAGALATHHPLVPQICVNELGHHWSSNGLSPVRRQAIASTNAVLFVNLTPGKTFLWNMNQNSIIFIQECN